MMTSVSTVDIRSSPITVNAIGVRSSLPSPSPSAIGSRPSTVVDVVIRIGRRLVRRRDLRLTLAVPILG